MIALDPGTVQRRHRATLENQSLERKGSSLTRITKAAQPRGKFAPIRGNSPTAFGRLLCEFEEIQAYTPRTCGGKSCEMSRCFYCYSPSDSRDREVPGSCRCYALYSCAERRIWYFSDCRRKEKKPVF